MIVCRCARLPPTVNHLVVVFTVPLVYPKLPLSQTVLTAVEGMPLLKGAMTKTGVGAGIIDKWAPPQLKRKKTFACLREMCPCLHGMHEVLVDQSFPAFNHCWH